MSATRALPVLALSLAIAACDGGLITDPPQSDGIVLSAKGTGAGRVARDSAMAPADSGSAEGGYIIAY